MKAMWRGSFSSNRNPVFRRYPLAVPVWNSTRPEQTALERIRAAFSDPDARLDMILVYPGRVSFHTVNGQYALVHMGNGEKPAFVNRPGESGAMRIRKIHDGWFHAVVKI